MTEQFQAGAKVERDRIMHILSSLEGGYRRMCNLSEATALREVIDLINELPLSTPDVPRYDNSDTKSQD